MPNFCLVLLFSFQYPPISFHFILDFMNLNEEKKHFNSLKQCDQIGPVFVSSKPQISYKSSPNIFLQE